MQEPATEATKPQIFIPPTAMTTERARQICKWIVQRMTFDMGLTDTVNGIADISLAEMLEAKRLVEEANRSTPIIGGSRTIQTVPDDRLIAAVYTLEHFEADNEETVISMPHAIGGFVTGQIKSLVILTIDPEETDAEEEEKAFRC